MCFCFSFKLCDSGIVYDLCMHNTSTMTIESKWSINHCWSLFPGFNDMRTFNVKVYNKAVKTGLVCINSKHRPSAGKGWQIRETHNPANPILWDAICVNIAVNQSDCIYLTCGKVTLGRNTYLFTLKVKVASKSHPFILNHHTYSPYCRRFWLW